jgi:UDP-3-O-[3-hydroxymyristoyl] glucosamine N-acyltransferase
MIKKLTELAQLANCDLNGAEEIEITGVADLKSAQAGDITFLTDARQINDLATTKATAAVVPEKIKDATIPIIRAKDPYLAIALIHNLFENRPFSATGIHTSVVIGDDCKLPAEVSIGPMVVIGKRVKIGDRVIIHPGVVIGDDAHIGSDTELHANVTVGHNCKLGKRVIVHAGTVIGSDGFGYATDQYGHHVKRPQVGFVQIDEDVEIGANSCLDRATFGRTWVKRGCKIDNLVQIAHNTVIGEDSIIVSQAGVAGSSTLGTGVIIGGQVGVSGHLKIGNRVMVGAKSGVHSNVPDNEVVSGYPAFSHKLWLRVCAIIPRLPQLFKDVRKIKHQLTEQGK